MNFYITKNQFNKIILESENEKLSNNMKELYSSLVNSVNKVNRKYKINLKMLLTWGPAVGGITAPLDNFLRNRNFSLDDNQIALLVCSAFFMAFFENRKQSIRLKQIVEKEGLSDTLDILKEKAIRLRKSFSRFLKSSGVLINNFSEAVAYSFLIPIITDIQQLISGTEDVDKVVVLIVKRLISSGLMMLTAETIFECIKKISKKLS